MSDEAIVKLSAPAFELMKQYEKENALYLDILMNPDISVEEKQIMKEMIQSNRKYKLIEEGMWMTFTLGCLFICRNPKAVRSIAK